MLHKIFKTADELLDFVNSDNNSNMYVDVLGITQDSSDDFHLFYKMAYSYLGDGWSCDDDDEEC